jgi:transposase
MREHCAHARFVWNLAVEQQSWWKRGRKRAPGYLEQCRQLTAARRENDWLRAGSQTVQQQALRDFDRAMKNFFRGTHRRPTFRKAGRADGFRIVAVKPGHVRRLNRRAGVVWVPKAGWVRFRWSRPVPAARSYRVSLDRSGRWHVAFAVIPAAIPGPGTGAVAGLDRGVAVSAALSTGELLRVPRPRPARQRRLVLLQRKLARARRGSGRRARVKLAIARLKAREADCRKDWCEKLSSACGYTAPGSRESQSRFRCVACNFACNADVNAALNIAAGQAVKARGGDRVTGPVKREPQHAGPLVA